MQISFSLQKSILQNSLCIYLAFSFTTIVDGASRAPVYASKGLVASVSPIASAVGADILRQGGNAADSAVAVGLALAVTWPSAGNIGGGGFALLRTPDGKTNFIDYRETAPAATYEAFFQDGKGEVIKEASTVGYRAVATPGTVAGLALLHQKYGQLPWSKLVAPARRLAKDGFLVDQAFVMMLERARPLLDRFPTSRRQFFPNGRLPKVGDRLIQADLGQTLADIEKHGPEAFYKGKVAKKLSSAIQKGGGVLSLTDLAQYRVVEREPLKGAYKTYQVITAPPPSSGGALLLSMLGMLESDKLAELGFGSAAYSHLLVETMKRGFADRAEWYGDPSFVSIPLAQLLAPEYLKARRASIDLQKATPSDRIKAGTFSGAESMDTTHFTVIDSKGMIISNTYTLNGSFGSGAVAEGTGILLNNEMDDFTSKAGSPNMYGLIQNARNAIAPGKRPLSSMTPTIILQDDKPILALGSPGGPTIINSVFQVTLNVLEHGMDVQAAIDAPKLHHQWLPDRIQFEPFGTNPDSRRLLESMGHTFTDRPAFFGDVQAVLYDKKRQQWTGGSDSRLGGAAVAE